MKKLSILLTLFTLFSCSKDQNMSHTKIYYNGEEYLSNRYETTIEFIESNMSSDTKSVKVSMITSDTTGFIFTYTFSNNHSFIMRENSINKYNTSFLGNIIYENSTIRGSAYDRNGNYIIFSEI